MILYEFITDPAVVFQVETLRRTLLIIYEPYLDEEPLAMEILERLWSLEIEELFGSQAHIERARHASYIEGVATSSTLYNFEGLMVLQLGGYIRSLSIDAVHIKESVYYLLYLITYHFNANHSQSYENQLHDFWFVTERAHDFHANCSAKETTHYVSQVHREVRAQVRREMKSQLR